MLNRLKAAKHLVHSQWRDPSVASLPQSDAECHMLNTGFVKTVLPDNGRGVP